MTLHGGERIALGESTHLAVIHTPGHASNHLCYLLEEEKTLFTGDHVMQASTVVINPPDGDMAAYIASLRSLLDLDLDWLAPGHGFLMAAAARGDGGDRRPRPGARGQGGGGAARRSARRRRRRCSRTVYADVPGEAASDGDALAAPRTC